MFRTWRLLSLSTLSACPTATAIGAAAVQMTGAAGRAMKNARCVALHAVILYSVARIFSLNPSILCSECVLFPIVSALSLATGPEGAMVRMMAAEQRIHELISAFPL